MAKTSIGRSVDNAAVIGSDRPGNFAKAVESVGSEARVQAGQNANSAAQGARSAVSISQIINEAVRRSGIVITEGRFSKADVAAINSEIRKDPALAAALAHARGDYKRGKSKLEDPEVAADTGESEHSENNQASASQEGFGHQGPQTGTANVTGLHYSQPQTFDISSSPVPVRDIAYEMLEMFDSDGDGIITVRQVLEYFISHARHEIRFNEVELANIMKILTEGINESVASVHLNSKGRFEIRSDIAA